jgi:hypothetical protein
VKSTTCQKYLLLDNHSPALLVLKLVASPEMIGLCRDYWIKSIVPLV